MTAKRLWIGGVAAALTAAALLLGGVLAGGGSASQARTLTPAQLDRRGSVFAQRARETGDVSYYTRGEAAYRRALQAAPNDLPATIGLGALALARHEFREGLALGRRAVRLSPSTAEGYGVVGDALVELGRYPQAFATFDRMVSMKPSVSSYARVSYARELLGNISGAAQAMRYAVDASVGESEPLAWSHTQFGKLYWSHGQLAAAAREYRTALEVRPGYAPALDALALVDAAHGRLTRAIALSRRASEILPLPQYVATLGDLMYRAGDDAGARRQYALVQAIARLERANGVNVDLEIALFEVDHGIRLPRTVARARAAHAERPSIDGDDLLAWALARNGRCNEALHYSKLALRLGTQDAAKFFHRGVIERCLGHGSAARQWFAQSHATNPYWRQP
jgi:tetratricopeptide (TPR) repeat protein